MTKTTHRFTLTAMAALSTLAAAGAVQAQNVTLYGVIDTGIETVSNTAAGGTITRLPSNTGIFASRWGMRGKEDLGGGLAAVFTLESGFSPDTGAMGQGGRLFGRQALVGLSGDWGAVTLGRQYSMLYWSMMDADIVGPSVFGVGSLDAYVPNSRHDNAIVYRGKFDALSLGASYSLGRDTAAATPPNPTATNCAGEAGSDVQACRAWSLMAKYDTASWGAALAYDLQHGRTLTSATDTVFGGLTSSAKTDARLSVNGYAKFGDAKVAAGLIRRDNDGSATRPKSNLWYVGASYALSPAWTVDGTVARLAYKDVSNADSTLVAVRALYKLSKRTTVYGQLGHISNQSAVAVSVSGGAAGSNPLAGGSQTGTMFGINHAF
ncbi:outer membrane porin protein 32 [Comamonadaceae bacterium OS-1]|nr:outer membrane porin protein 32 [Comamonadaceae bacterium OS-1]